MRERDKRNRATEHSIKIVLIHPNTYSKKSSILHLVTNTASDSLFTVFFSNCCYCKNNIGKNIENENFESLLKYFI